MPDAWRQAMHGTAGSAHDGGGTGPALQPDGRQRQDRCDQARDRLLPIDADAGLRHRHSLAGQDANVRPKRYGAASYSVVNAR